MQASDIISVIALIVSLIAGAVATWVGYVSNQRDLTSTTYANANGMLLEVDRMVVDYPQFRPYLYGKKQLDPTDPDQDKILACAVMVLDIAEYIWQRRDEIQEDVDRHAWQLWLLSLFDTSPTLAALYAEHPEWYPNLELLQRRGPPSSRK
ncbi:hypothetical protein ASH01_09335 [Terrabacter sp. Soil811]|uniref:hypothetical protein n=1 Tax=Terrabacter sp. Soil811 TaxID=1736419 RepID=UPI0006FD1639|nr:hypothetical protein [Terrabacter sp. Soil811]KRF45961.1 hypothetical protein ASH01_09335 [Terrabacter sp. Soil811]